MTLVNEMINSWQDARRELAGLDAAEHPDVTDRFGRVWAWKSGDLYTHDGTLAFPRKFIDDESLGLPSAQLADNPNYSRLCTTCRSDWNSE